MKQILKNLKSWHILQTYSTISNLQQKQCVCVSSVFAHHWFCGTIPLAFLQSSLTALQSFERSIKIRLVQHTIDMLHDFSSTEICTSISHTSCPSKSEMEDKERVISGIAEVDQHIYSLFPSHIHTHLAVQHREDYLFDKLQGSSNQCGRFTNISMW